MGHRFSKTAANNIAAKTKGTTKTTTSTTYKNNPTTTTKQQLQYQTITTSTSNPIPTTNIIPIPSKGNQQLLGPAINLQIEESTSTCFSSGTTYSACGDKNHIKTAACILHQKQQQQQPQQQFSTSNISSSLTPVNNLPCGRQIIIKIQLAKMENGNEISALTQQQQDTSLESLTADCNLNSSEISTAADTQFLNLTLNNNCSSMSNPPAAIQIPTTTSLSSSASALSRTAGSSLNKNFNYLNSNSSSNINDNHSCSLSSSILRNERPERLNALQFNNEIVEENIDEIVEYCEVLEQQQSGGSANMQRLPTSDDINEANVCCLRKSKNPSTNGGSLISSNNNTGAKTKNRCRKCSCRDAFRRFLDPSLSRSSNKASKQQQQKEQKRGKSQDRHSSNNPLLNNMKNQNQQHQHQHNIIHSATNIISATVSTRTPTTAIVLPPATANQVAVWAPATSADGNDVIIPFTTPATPQFVVVQCAIVNATNATVHPLPHTTTSSSSSPPTNSLISLPPDISPISSPSNNIMVKVPSNTRPVPTAADSVMDLIIHSQVDFVHYLVPDLERITNSSFYWGKMDRYEAERLLEGKPEGTFLLRDSAQEEFLFSVTFRKYGRSLHARIEQSGHRFSFDCHDPCVFTAPTVTGLLEHYKDPACVMFFEPMLTIPLHRKNCFSLQKLCRATIVSHTTYDGINELELPARLKSYLKEYHYKQKLRVKSNEPTYTIHCK